MAKATERQKRQYELFQKECGKWIRYFGLLSWDVWYEHNAEDGANGHCCTTYGGQRKALIGMSPNPDAPVPDIAFHEACELLLARVRELAMSRAATNDDIDSAIHEVIETLGNTLYRDVKPKG